LFCCASEGRVAFIIEGPSKDAVLEIVQQQIDIPEASIFEVEEVTPNVIGA